MKKVIGLLITICFLFTIQSQVEAQVSTPITIAVEKQTQQPKTKTLPIIITVTSSVDSDRFELLLIPDAGIDVKGEKLVLTKISANQPLEFKVDVQPRIAGERNLQIKAQAWQAGENLVAIHTEKFNFAQDLQIQPQTNEYFVLAARSRALDLALYITIGTIVIAIIAYGYYQFRSWLDSDVN